MERTIKKEPHGCNLEQAKKPLRRKKKEHRERRKKHLLENPRTKTYFQTATKAQRDDLDKKRSKRILCVETGDIFIGAKAAAEWAGLKNRQSIYFCCEGVGYHKTAGGYHWKYVNKEF